MKPRTQFIIYTIPADDKPVAALEATGMEARELLNSELSGLKVDGEPVYKPLTRLRARPATEEEWAKYDRECRAAFSRLRGGPHGLAIQREIGGPVEYRARGPRCFFRGFARRMAAQLNMRWALPPRVHGAGWRGLESWQNCRP